MSFQGGCGYEYCNQEKCPAARRIRKNYRIIIDFNTALILLGVGGLLQPASSALLHNTSTLVIGLKSMQDLLD